MIDTPDGRGIESKEFRIENCKIQLVYTDGSVSNLGTAGIKVRGNTTAEQPKKPYNIKFETKQSILDMKSSKHWILLSNPFYDRTQLHNATAFEIARLTDFPWVQSGKFVELFLNGEHKGLYYLCEKIDVEKDRINIDKLKVKDIDDDTITGGYLIESDVYKESQTLKEQYTFVTDYFNRTGSSTAHSPGFSWVLGWFLKSPDEDVPEEQLNYISSHMNTMESLIYDDEHLLEGTYRDYFDIETAINWWLVEELCCNEEATRSKNLYMYKKREDNKIYVGSPWDFDALTFGFSGTVHLWVKNTALYYRQLLKDPYFIKRVKEKWEIYKPL